MKQRIAQTLLPTLLLALVLGLPAGAQRNILTREQAQADMDTLYRSIRDIHPDLFAVYPGRKFGREFRAIRDGLPDTLSVAEFYRLFAPLVARLGDGHTQLGFPLNRLDDNRCLPLLTDIRQSDTALLVQADFSGAPDSIPQGARIRRINGLDAGQLLMQMVQPLSGEKFFHRMAVLNNRFGIMLAVLYPAARYTIDYEYGGKTHSAVREKVPPEVFFPACARQGESLFRPDFTFDILPGNVGLIGYNNCPGPEAVRPFLDSVFRIVARQRIADLIIDVRRNSGGNSQTSDEFFQYISPRPFVQFGATVVKISDTFTRLGGEQPWKYKHRNGTYRTGKKKPIPLRDNPLRYSGRCHLLTSHSTFSSGADFAWTFHYFRMGKVVGEETGGMVVSFGDALTFRLPHSGLSASVSFKKFRGYGAKKNAIHGVIPDYAVPEAEALDYVLKRLVGK